MAELVGPYPGPLLDIDGNPLTNKYNGKPLTTAIGKYIRVKEDLFVDLGDLPAHLRIALNVKGLRTILMELRQEDPSSVEGGNFKIEPPVITLYGYSDWLSSDMGFPKPTEETQRRTEEVWQQLSPGYDVRRDRY